MLAKPLVTTDPGLVLLERRHSSLQLGEGLFDLVPPFSLHGVVRGLVLLLRLHQTQALVY